MAWRVITIENPARLSLRDNKIVIGIHEKFKNNREKIDENLAEDLSQNNENSRENLVTKGPENDERNLGGDAKSSRNFGDSSSKNFGEKPSQNLTKIAEIPLEDIDTLVLDNYAISLSANLLNGLARKNIATILCDEKHLPCAEVLPLSQHSRQAKISRMQLAISEPLRKNLWRKIVVQKIQNQAKVLAKFGFENDAKTLENLAKNVKSGDTTNRESIAARIYFARLLDDATRRKPIWHNAALNYGYAIVRGCIARSVAARGLIASQGIFHRSELNAFNLVDDLIEPFRAAVDEYILRTVAARHVGETDFSLTKTDRELMIDILNQSVMILDKKFSIKHAADLVAESFAKAVQSGEIEMLNLPKIG